MSPLPAQRAFRQVRPAISARSAAAQIATLVIGGSLAILLAGDGPNQVTITLTLIYVAYASAWNIVAGYAGQFTFGHSAFFGLGSYAATLLTIWFGIPPFFGLWFGVVVAAMAAAAIGVITLKLRGLYFGLVTAVFPIVFSVFASYLGFQEVSVPFNPAGGLMYFTPDNPRILSAAALGATTLIALITVWLVRSRFGLFLGALRADQDAAEASGIATLQVKIYALMLSAGLSAIAGALYASAALVVTPIDAFGLQMSVKPVLFSVFGGIGTLAGPVVGAAILVPLSEGLTATFGTSLPGLSGLVYGLALLLVITLFPAGLVPVLTKAGRKIRIREQGGVPSPAAAPEAPPVIRAADPPLQAAGRRCGGGAILEINGITKAFGGTRVLLGVTMQVACGEILGVIGPNGAGKTTLFNVVNGFVRPDAGEIRLGGRDITRAKPSMVARAGLGRTFQTVRVFSNMSALENVHVAALTRHRLRSQALEAAWTALGEVGLEERAHVPVDGLTTGELRRLELARAMATAGTDGLLLLDEFLGGLTSADGAVLLAALRRWRDRGGSVVAIEHTMRAMAGFVDRFVVLNFGEVIAEGLPEEIWRNREVVKAYLGEKWVA
jgi:ABC-type branched-subunit amino acid transport system ATPase component/ABC-type branched-subunit amino acid transport system permease subunit